MKEAQNDPAAALGEPAAEMNNNLHVGSLSTIGDFVLQQSATMINGYGAAGVGHKSLKRG